MLSLVYLWDIQVEMSDDWISESESKDLEVTSIEIEAKAESGKSLKESV